MAQVVLIGRDWKTRALLRAQLLEEGVEAAAYETPADAVQAFSNHPTLILADISGSDEPSSELDQLARWARFIPAWILASRSLIGGSALEGRGFERIIFRPVTIGDLVAAVKMRLNTAA